MVDEAQSSPPDKEQATEQKERFIEPQPMREDQVQNAVNFLSHPKVKGSAVVYRRSFLERKGLTKEEIDEAFRRVPDPPSSAAAAAQEPAKPAVTQLQAPAAAVQSSLQQLQTVPLPRKGVRWSQIVLAIGLMSAAGAGAAVVTKKYLYPKLRAWLRHVVLDEETQKPKPVADSEASRIAAATASAAAATAAAAAAAAEMATIAKELMAFRTEDHRYMDGLLKSLKARDQEIKATLDALVELQRNTRLLSSTANGEASVKKGYVNQGTEDVKLSSGPGLARSARPLTSSPAAASTNAPHSPSYMEVLAMVERGEKPPGIREVQDKPPNANQAPSDSLFPPKPKPWETRAQSNGSESVPWWRQKADTTSVRITELDDKAQGQSSNGRGWVPPPAPKPLMPGVDAAIRYRPSQKSPPRTPDTQSSVPAARYHEMNGDSASTVTDKGVDSSNSSEPEVYKEATQEQQQLYEVEQDERRREEQQEAETQRQREDEIQQQEDEIQKQQEGEVHVDLS